MLKEVISKLDYSLFEEFAIVLFGLSFAMIVMGTLWLRRDAAERFSKIPLADGIVDPRPNNSKSMVTERKEA